MNESIYSIAKERIEAFVAKIADSRSLSSDELKQYKGFDFSAGWSIPNLYADASLELRILINPMLPYKQPRIAVWPSPPVLTWPHLEEYGLLCLTSSKTSSSITQIEDVLLILLSRADKLIADCLGGKLNSDFLDEFLSYWVRWEKFELRPTVVSHLTSDVTQGIVYGIWLESDLIHVSDSKDYLNKWFVNWLGQEVNQKINQKIEKVFLVDLKRAFLPSEYPCKLRDFYDLISKENSVASNFDDFILEKSVKDKVIICRFPWGNGSSYFALRIAKKLKKLPGFRQNLLAPKELQLNYSFQQNLHGLIVERFDHDWIHGRGYNEESKVLKRKTVWIFGLGSVGSGLIEMLTKAGVGSFVLVDPETLETANFSRHTLGVDSVFKNKAEALAKKLRREFPHLSFSFIKSRAECFLLNSTEDFDPPDLIISAIGEWGSEAFILSQVRSKFQKTAIVFVWLEPHASVGQAAVIVNSESCLACILDDVGRPKMAVTKWDNDSILLKIPACGGEFQPYGAIELGHSIALFAEVSLSVLLENERENRLHIWIGRKRILEKNGGIWNSEWERIHGAVNEGGKFVSLPITQDFDCPICGKQ